MMLPVHRESLSSRKQLLLLVALSILTSLVIFTISSTLRSINPTAHATLAGFNAGNIMDDAVMSNKGALSEAQIQTFLLSKNSCNDKPSNHPTITWTYKNNNTEVWAGGGTWRYYLDSKGNFICMAKQSFNGETAAHIIWQAAQDYSINPQVLIVLLQKEQGLVTDTYPNYNIQYKTATGYGCPDNGDCDADYFGFKNQVSNAANLFRTVLSGGWTNYPIGNNYIQYNPDKSCGGSTVNIKNLATSALYRYTPYQPNAAALAAGTGTASCGAYGNRNFYNYFTDWFGSTHYLISGSIGAYYDANNGPSVMGLPIENIAQINSTNQAGYKQCFQNGCILGSSTTGYFLVKGSIANRYWDDNGPSGRMGLPAGEEVSYGDNIYYQKYQFGYIVGRKSTGYWEVKGSIGAQYNPESDIEDFGLPLGTEIYSYNGAWAQQYEKGYIYGSSQTGYWKVINKFYNYAKSSPYSLGLPIGSAKDLDEVPSIQQFQYGTVFVDPPDNFTLVRGSILTTYRNLGGHNSKLGIPTSNEQASSGSIYEQKFQNGIIIGERGKYYEIRGSILSYWQETGGELGMMGLPTGPTQGGTPGDATWQHFVNGVIIVNPKNNQAWESKGSIREVWKSLGYQDGVLGYPTGPEEYSSNDGTWSQTYEHGTITTKHGVKYKVTYN